MNFIEQGNRNLIDSILGLRGEPMPHRYRGSEFATPASLAMRTAQQAIPNATLGDLQRRTAASAMLPELLQQQAMWEDQQRRGREAMRYPGMPGGGVATGFPSPLSAGLGITR